MFSSIGYLTICPDVVVQAVLEFRAACRVEGFDQKHRVRSFPILFKAIKGIEIFSLKLYRE